MKKQGKISKIVVVSLLLGLVLTAIFIRPIFALIKDKPVSETIPPVQTSSGGIIEDKNIDNANNISEAQPEKPTALTSSDANYTTSLRQVKSPINKEVSRGNPDKKMVALTLDAGASATQAPAILKILKDNNVHVTFFLTGKWAEQNPAIVREMASNGNTFGNHTYDHTDLTTLSDVQIKDEFEQTETIVKKIVPGSELKPYFRPPYGSRNAHVLQAAADDGYQSIYWTTDALDWMDGQTYQGKLVDNAFVENRILDNVKNGSIILMHIGDDITPAILQDIIVGLKNQGYEIVTIDTLLKNI